MASDRHPRDISTVTDTKEDTREGAHQEKGLDRSESDGLISGESIERLRASLSTVTCAPHFGSESRGEAKRQRNRDGKTERQKDRGS